MFDRFSLADLRVRVVCAPMSGGPSTPALAAAVSNAGGLGFLAGDMSSAEDLADAIEATRLLTSGPIGVNLPVPQRSMVGSAEEIDAYAAILETEAQHYGVVLGEPRHDYDEWAAKLEVVYDLRPEVVSYTYGLPNRLECRRLSAVGVLNLATITTVHEALCALSCGVDAVVAQGPAAGGHRATVDPRAVPPDDPLDDLVANLTSCCECPVVAAGGVSTGADARKLWEAGAAAVQLGTAFLLADEAGTSAVHRAALRNPVFIGTVVTRAFTGRYGRVLRNRFTQTYDPHAVFGFPQVASMTEPLRAAALKMGDPHGVALWAGSNFSRAKTGSAADIIDGLVS